MFKKILVPLDGSPLAEQALPLAGRLLEASCAEMTLFAVGEAPLATRLPQRGLRRPLPLASAISSSPRGLIPASPPSYVESKDQAVERREHELLEYLDEAGRLWVEAGHDVHAAVHFGDPAKEIIALV